MNIYKRVKVWKTFDAEFLKEVKLKVYKTATATMDHSMTVYGFFVLRPTLVLIIPAYVRGG
jgi:hypothetical protein